jgi:hypothetical protein
MESKNLVLSKKKRSPKKKKKSLLEVGLHKWLPCRFGGHSGGRPPLFKKLN